MSLIKINGLGCQLTDISWLKESELKHPGTEMQMIFQNPKSSLNPG